MSLCDVSYAATNGGWHLDALVLVTASVLPSAHGCGVVRQELRLVVALIANLGSWTIQSLTCVVRLMRFLD